MDAQEIVAGLGILKAVADAVRALLLSGARRRHARMIPVYRPIYLSPAAREGYRHAIGRERHGAARGPASSDPEIT